jgi:hypothetical protein
MASGGDKSGSLRQKFNDDLLIHQEDRVVPAKLYPRVLHLVDHPEVRPYFVEYDESANAAKKKSRKEGSTVIVLASITLFSASGEIVLHEWPQLLVFLARAGVARGILSIVIGSMCVLYGSSKGEWLHRRLMTERIRQFTSRHSLHFSRRSSPH